MESKRSDNRRRRVLYDEAVQNASAPLAGASGDAAQSKRRRSNNYVARRSQQLKTSDLIPIRWLTYGLIAAGSLATIGILNALQWIASIPGDVIDPFTRQAFSLTGPNSIASWCSAVGFILASLFGLQIFAMRRHRRDDYRGTYRVWLVLCSIFVIASLQCIVPLERIGATLLAKTIRSPVFVPGEFGIVGLKLAFLAAVFVRMVIEIRHSRSATCLLVVTFLTFAFAAALEVPIVAQALVPDAHYITDNLFLFGCFALLNSVIAYSRYVSLDVQGRLARRLNRSRKRSGRKGNQRDRRRTAAATSRQTSPVDDESEEKWSDSEEGSTSAPPSTSNARDNQKSSPLKSKMDAMKSNREDEDDESWEDEGDSESSSNSRLSKAERRRLKKSQRQRHAA